MCICFHHWREIKYKTKMKLLFSTFILLTSHLHIAAQKDSSGIFTKRLSNSSSKTWHVPVLQKDFTFNIKSKTAEWIQISGRDLKSRKFSNWTVKKQANNTYLLISPKSENYFISFKKQDDNSWILVLKNKPPSPTKYIVDGEYFEK